MKYNIELRKPRSFAANVNETIEFIKQNFKPLLKATLIISGVFIGGDVIMDSLKVILQAQRHFGSSFYTTFFLQLIFIFLSYLSVYLVSLCYIVLYQQKKCEAPTVAEVWAYFKYYFFRVLGTGILMGFLLFIFILVCMIPAGLFISGLSVSFTMANPAILAVVYGFCLLLFFIPIIYIMPALGTIFPIMVIENASFLYCYKRSFKLIKNYWWPTFGVLFIFTSIIYLCNAIIVLPLTVLMQGQLMLLSSAVYVPVAIISSILKGVVLISNLLPSICMCMCYYNLVERKEEVGLIERIDTFGVNDVVAGPQQIATEEY
jgi:hypothetical protein